MNAFIFLPILILTKNTFFAIMQTLPFIFMISGEIALNDCCDIEKDKISKPQRPLVKGNINIHYAFITSICFIFLSTFLGCIIYAEDLSRIVCFLFVVVILSAYNLKLSIIPVVKTIITSLATVISLSFVYTYFDITYTKIYFLISSFFYILGRELLMDIRDIAGDKMNDYTTIAVVFGVTKTRVMSLISFILSTIWAVIMLLSDFSYLDLLLLFVIVVLEIVFISKCFKSSNSKIQNKYILFLWMPIILMLIIQIF